MFCTNCAAKLGPTDLFCGRCGTRVKSPDAASDDVQYVGESILVPSISTRTTASTPSARGSASHQSISSTSSLTNEVRVQKAATIKQDRSNSKDILLTSSFGLDP
jgi:hypothetical protein